VCTGLTFVQVCPPSFLVPLQRGRTPIVVGGTGFYLRFLQEGKPAGNKTTPDAAQAVKRAIQAVRWLSVPPRQEAVLAVLVSDGCAV